MKKKEKNSRKYEISEDQTRLFTESNWVERHFTEMDGGAEGRAKKTSAMAMQLLHEGKKGDSRKPSAPSPRKQCNSCGKYFPIESIRKHDGLKFCQNCFSMRFELLKSKRRVLDEVN